MTALHRVKAYFGMVPADELDSYDGYGDYDDRRHVRERHDDYDRYGSDRYGVDRYGDRYGDRDRERWSDRHDERWADREPESLSRSRADDRDARDGREAREPSELRTRTPRPRDPEPELEAAEQAAAARPASRGRSWAQNTGPNHTSVRSGLSGPVRVSSGSGSSGSSSGSGSSSPAAPALAPVASAGTSATAPVAAAPSGASAVPSGTSAPTATSSASASSSSGPTAVTRGALAVDESRRPVAAAVPEPPADTPAPAEISSIQPQSYNEARVIGERYRDGIPVIMNLTEMDDASAKRLVDFAAGLAFALRGSIEKVTNRVFLLSPPNVEVSAAERRKFAENGFTSGS